ncbi:MAG: histidine kinase [Pseudobacteriovorax sp.]|nr:histidine kinase [Pseudobacteriovorax sp.]
MKLLLLAILICLGAIVPKSNSLNAETLYLEAKTTEIDFGINGYYYFDDDNNLNLKQIWTKFQNDEFTMFPEKNGRFGFTKSAIWSVTTVHREPDALDCFYFAKNYSSIDRLDYWLVDSKGQILDSASSGDIKSFHRNSISNRFPTVKFEIPQGETYLVTRAFSPSGSLLLAEKAMSPGRFHSRQILDYSLGTSLLCMLSLMVVYNLFLYIQLKKTSIFFYVIFIASVTLTSLGQTGMGMVYFDQFSFIMNKGFTFFGLLAICAAFWFSNTFLELYRRKWQYMLMWLGLGPALVGLGISVFDYKIGVFFNFFSGTYLSIFALLIGIVRSCEGFRPAYFYTLGWLCLIIANILRYVMIGGMIRVDDFINWGTLASAVIESALLSLGLAEKIRLFEKNSLDKINSLNANLESKSNKLNEVNIELEKMILLEKNNSKVYNRMLTHKMRPHFLFNTLNSINAAMIESPEAASTALTELGRLYRKILQGGESITWQIQDEVDLVKDYLNLQKLRFEDRLKFRFDMKDLKSGYECPCFSIQTLVENSIKHSISKSIYGGEIIINGGIDGENYRVSVYDSVPDATSSKIEYVGYGLRNLETRLNSMNSGDKNLIFETHENGTNAIFWVQKKV